MGERLQSELAILHESDVKNALEDSDDRKKLENKEMNAVKKILGDDIELNDFLSLDLSIIKNLLPSQKRELILLQKELQKLNEKDLENDNQNEQRKNNETNELEKVQKLIGEDIDLL